MKYHLPLIVYDPDCPLCLRFKQGLEFLNKNLTFIPVDDENIYNEYPSLTKQICQEEVHMITSEKLILRGSAVVDELIKTLPGISKFAWLLNHEQGKKARDYFYQKVEELREISKEKHEGNCNQCPRK